MPLALRHAVVLQLGVAAVVDDVAVVGEVDVHHTQVLGPGETLRHQRPAAVATGHYIGVVTHRLLVGRGITCKSHCCSHYQTNIISSAVQEHQHYNAITIIITMMFDFAGVCVRRGGGVRGEGWVAGRRGEGVSLCVCMCACIWMVMTKAVAVVLVEVVVVVVAVVMIVLVTAAVMVVLVQVVVMVVILILVQ